MQPHQPSYYALKLSAENGCRLCNFFCIALRDGDGQNSAAAWSQVSAQYPGRQISLVAWGGVEKNFDRIHIATTGDIPSSDEESDAELDDPTMHPDHQRGDLNGRINGRPLPKNCGDSDEDFATIDQWLAACCSQHSHCRKPDSYTSLPTRVIDVGIMEGRVEPYLIESKGLSGLYVTLSHCWGGEVALTTTTKNIDVRQRGIPLDSMPKTFRDAVFVTRKLGIRYLWIDSLCILQDSADDWQRESGVMEAVYRNGYLNLSARSATNSSVGFFFQRAPEPPACRLNWTGTDRRGDEVQGSLYIRSPEQPAESVRQSPCDRRGWILQEQLLSPRVLYFGSDQLQWECCEASLRQDGRLDDDALDRFGNFPHLKVVLGLSAISASTYACDSRSHSWWAILVQEYTRRQLTIVTDKLPAISGLAMAYQKITGYTYISGAWQEEMPRALAWRKPRGVDMLVCPKQPTWSWAKMSGQVHFAATWPEQVMEAECTIVGVRVQRVQSMNRFDDITAAEVDMRGHVLQVLHRSVPETPSGYPGNSIFTIDGHELGFIVEDAPISLWPNDTELYCVLITTGPSPSGIVLSRYQCGRQKGFFRRIGFLVANSTRGENGQMLSDEQFLKTELRTITIL
ncbi:HET-domain-containing protein [Plenodomus tracheiphilus IPT5]|uniref:HET-domain-containing protein n=1 Tax=Plenodomus tracheiphilus IPT5 TaxID=1408161 RepID=A0A6A7BLV1_9PLEO|nr:HET-domain-containing protein [Plenodomus tracheiphilus IPT5]